jgi:hypothetical protein
MPREHFDQLGDPGDILVHAGICPANHYFRLVSPAALAD